MRIASIIALAATLLLSPAILPTSAMAQEQKPTINAEKRVIHGGKSIWQKQSYSQVMFCIDNDIIGSFIEAFNFGKLDIGPVFFLDSDNEILPNGTAFVGFPRDATSSDVKLGTFRQQMTLLDNGLTRIESILKLNDPSIQKSRLFNLQMPDYLKMTGQYTINGKTVTFDGNSNIDLTATELKGSPVRFFVDDPAKSFSITLERCDMIRLMGNRLAFVAPADGHLSILVDIGGELSASDSGETLPNGINMWEVDGIHMPDFSASRNLVQNPSFEAGFRYWGTPNYVHSAIPLKYKSLYEIDDKEAHTGSRSLKIRAIHLRSPQSIGTFALPYVPGENYTISFYVKGSTDHNLKVNCWARGRLQLFEPSVKQFDVTTEWQRITIPVTANERFGSIYFDTQYLAAEGQEATVWIDDVQLEKGEATDFASPALNAALLSEARGNFLEHGTPANFRLEISSAANATGTVKIGVEDFFFKEIFDNAYPIKLDGNGKATIALDDLSKFVADQNLRGEFIVSAQFIMDGNDKPIKDHYRFSIMNFMDGTHRNKNIFNLCYVYSPQAGGPEMERYVQREQAIGFGSYAYDFIRFANDMDLDLDKERHDLLAKYGFAALGRPMLKLHDGVEGEISEKGGEVVMQNIKTMTNPTDEQLKEFEAIAELKASRRPWNTIWWFTGESNPGVMPLEASDGFAKFLLATYRGAKKGNPNAQVLVEGGPWNIDPEYGVKWVERYIQETKKLDPSVDFDGAAGHFYHNFPEHPDLDAEITAFVDMLDRNGKSHWPLHLNEGGNYAPFNIPQEGISPYISHSANWWYFGQLSYHYGRAERIALAFSARNWIIALKHQDRVACMQDFNTPNRFTDFDFTARPYDKIPNTLSRLLGDAAFYKDVKFGPDTRCYLFIEDKTKAPIAVVWGCSESVDRWKADAPLYAFDFGQQKLTFIDLMENETTFEKNGAGKTVIPASPFPIFIKGEPGSEEALLAAISAGTPTSGSTSGIKVSAYPDTNGKANIVFTNTISRGYEGKAKINLNGKDYDIDLAVDGEKSVTRSVDLPPGADGKLLAFNAAVTIGDGEPIEIKNSYIRLNASPRDVLTVDSPVADWRKVSAIEIDGGIAIRQQVSGKNLLIAIEDKNKTADTTGESLIGTALYLDPFGKVETWNKPRGVNEELAVFEIVKGPDGKPAAYSHFVAGTQQGSGSYLIAGDIQKLIQVRTTADDKGSMVVLSIPQEVLAPLILQAGNRYGINVMVPDAAGGRHSLAPIADFKTIRESGEITLINVMLTR